MRPTPATVARLARAAISQPSAASSPLRSYQRLARPAQKPCIFCVHRVSSQAASRRYQSTSTQSSPQREDTNPPPQTHYTFFPSTLPAGPPPNSSFAIDLNALKKEFLQLQAQAHPDRHPPENKSKAQALSARINEAYKTLQNPLLRAQYLLSLRGIEVAEDETAKVEDPELLMEVLETRETIEEAEAEADLRELKTTNDARVDESVKTLEDAFAKDEMDAAKSEAVKLRYWINIKDSLDNWEPGKPVVLQH